MTLEDTNGLDRRSFLRLGGLTVAVAALVAACDNTEAGSLGRVGNAPPTTKLPDAVVNDVVLLRTASSLQHSILNVYNEVKDKPELLDPANRALIDQLVSDHQAHAQLFEQLTTKAGGTPWTCGNTRFDSALVQRAFVRITTATPATADAKEIPASDDKRRDILNLVHGMETILTAAYQQFVVMFNARELRAESLRVAIAGARRSALLALTINTVRPEGYISIAELTNSQVAVTTTTVTGQSSAATTTTAAGPAGGNAPTPIPVPTAIPATFGSTASYTIVVGAGDQNGTRLKVILDTPSLNSFEYEYLTPAC